MNQSDASKVSALNRVDLQRARQCTEPSHGVLGLARELRDPCLVAESLIVELTWITIRGEFREIQTLVAGILTIIDNDVEQLDPLFAWIFFHARGIVATNCLEYPAAQNLFDHSLRIADSTDNKRARTSGLLIWEGCSTNKEESPRQSRSWPR